MKTNWIITSLISGIIGGLIAWLLTGSWQIGILSAVLIFVIVLMSNPKRRFMKAFWVVLSILVILNRFYFEIIGNVSGTSYKVGSNEIGDSVSIFLIILAALCLLLDYLERNGILKGTLFKTNKNTLGDVSGNNIQINQNISENPITSAKNSDTKINKVKAEGQNIFVFQYIDNKGNTTEVRKSFDEFIRPRIEPYNKQIQQLQQTIRDKTKIEGLLDKEVFTLSAKLTKLEQERESLQKQVRQLLENIENVELSENSESYQNLIKLFSEGKITKLSEARTILDPDSIDDVNKLKQKLKKRANEFLILAQIAAMDFDLVDRFDKAKIYFEKSIEANRNSDNLFKYGFFLQSHKQYSVVQPYYEEALSLLKSEEDSGSKINRSKIGLILNSLGSLNQIKNNFKSAEQSYEEALNVYNNLNKEENNYFLMETGMVMNNLGGIHLVNNNFPKAEKILNEALQIRRTLAVRDKKYLYDVGMTLNNLGSLYNSSNQIDKSEVVLLEALDIRRQLARLEPNIYTADVGMTLGNVGVLYVEKKEINKARQAFKESLDIYRQLSVSNPYTYLPYLGSALHCLGNFNHECNNLKDAEIELKETLKIRRTLADNIRSVYLPDVSRTLNNLGNVYRDKKEFVKAEAHYHEALTILEGFVNVNPQVHMPDFAAMTVNMSVFYCYDYPRKEESISLALDVIKIVTQFQHIPRVVLYGGRAIQVLQQWGIDVESLFQKNESPK